MLLTRQLGDAAAGVPTVATGCSEGHIHTAGGGAVSPLSGHTTRVGCYPISAACGFSQLWDLWGAHQAWIEDCLRHLRARSYATQEALTAIRTTQNTEAAKRRQQAAID